MEEEEMPIHQRLTLQELARVQAELDPHYRHYTSHTKQLLSQGNLSIQNASKIFQYLRTNVSKNIIEVLQYLKKKRVVSNYPFALFVTESFAYDIVSQNSTSAKILARAYQQYLKNSKIKEKLVIPIVCRNTLQFSRQCIKWYFHEFHKEQMPKSQKQIQVKESNITQEFYELFPQRNRREIKEHHLQVPRQKNNILERSDQIEEGNVEKLYQQDNFEEINPFNIPHFLISDKQGVTRLAFKRLISIQVTNLFEDELNQVKDLILNQIKDEKSYLMRKYQILMKRYEQYYCIKQGLFEHQIEKSDNFIDQKVKNYQQVYLNQNNFKVHYWSQHKSELKQYWCQLFKILKGELERPKDYNIQGIIKEKLENVYLYYTPLHQTEKTFASTNSNGIFISLSHAKANNSLKEFREGPLRPYLTICLYHQLAHQLVRVFKRRFSQFQNDRQRRYVERSQRRQMKRNQDEKDSSYQHSFELNLQSVGSNILKIVLSMADEIKEVFSEHKITCSEDFKRKIKNGQQIQQKVLRLESLINSFEEKKHIKSLLRINFDSLQKMQKLINIFTDFDNLLKSIDHSVQWQTLLRNIIEYDSAQISRQDSKKQYQANDINKLAFEDYFIMNVILENIECLTIFQDISQQDKIQVKAAIKEKKIFLGNHKFINSIIISIKQRNKDFFSSSQAKNFQATFLYKTIAVSLNQLRSQIVAFTKQNKKEPVERIDEELLQQCMKQLAVFSIQMDKLLGRLHPKRQIQNQSIQKIYNRSEIFSLIDKMLLALSQYQCALKFIKRSEIYYIASQLPDFIFQKFEGSNNDSGFYLQKLLYPSLLKNKNIYGKDYQILKNLNDYNVNQLGKLPSAQNQLIYLECTKNAASTSPSEHVCQVAADGYDTRSTINATFNQKFANVNPNFTKEDIEEIHELRKKIV